MEKSPPVAGAAVEAGFAPNRPPALPVVPENNPDPEGAAVAVELACVVAGF